MGAKATMAIGETDIGMSTLPAEIKSRDKKRVQYKTGLELDEESLCLFHF